MLCTMIARGVLGLTALFGALLIGAGSSASVGEHGVDAHRTGVVERASPPGKRPWKPSPTCPVDTFADPDTGVCLRIPNAVDAPEATAEEAGHHDRHGTWSVYEQIPRRPDRPADYEAYRFPLPPALPNGKHVISGYDLDQPDEGQRRGRTLRAVGHGGLDIPQARGTPIHLVALESQEGDAEVVYVGTLFGTTVVTRHTIHEGGRLRDYLVLFGHLDRPAPGLAPSARLQQDDVVGFVGDTGSPELVHLHLETRRVRDGVDVTKVGVGRLLDATVSVVCDPRNVLPRKP